MDDVFRALDDPHRRRLLDGLFEADGRTLGELCDLVPGMTRQGVMNHLRVLEEAHLVSTVKDGRRKLHYLNPVPIRLVLDRWIAKYAEPAVEHQYRYELHGPKLSGGQSPTDQLLLLHAAGPDERTLAHRLRQRGAHGQHVL